jgi:hypothetical protein
VAETNPHWPIGHVFILLGLDEGVISVAMGVDKGATASGTGQGLASNAASRSDTPASRSDKPFVPTIERMAWASGRKASRTFNVYLPVAASAAVSLGLRGQASSEKSF